jgi:hypothetical protein
LKANIEAAMLEYTNNLDKWNIQICSLCKTSNVYNKKPFDASNYHCAKCSAKKKRNYLSSQDADPGSIPAHLPRLTFMEEQLIALVSINQHVYFRRSDVIASKGHSICFAQDPSQIANTLPRLSSDLNVVVIRKRGTQGICQELKVRCKQVKIWLEWLVKYNPCYRNIKIDYSRLADLPEEDELKDVPTIETEHEPNYEEVNPYNSVQKSDVTTVKKVNQIIENNDQIEKLSQTIEKSMSMNNFKEQELKSLDEISVKIGENMNNLENTGLDENYTGYSDDDDDDDAITGVVNPLSDNLTELEKIQQYINSISRQENGQPLPVLMYPQIDSKPLPEFGTPFLATMAFPCLFPYGRADPFGLDPHCNQETFLNKIRHLINHTEVINFERVSRFQRHTRFVLWIYNVYYRNALMGQSDIYIQQNPKDAALTREMLLELLEGPDRDNYVLKNMQRYMANIPGTPSYWHSGTQDLDAIIQSKGGPHVYFTLTFATNFDPDLHKFLGIRTGATKKEIKTAVNNNPYLVNKYFVLKMAELNKTFFQKALNGSVERGGWVWFRYEWQFRRIIHCHGLIRMGNAPDTYDLFEKCNTGYNLEMNAKEKNLILSLSEEQIVKIGKESEVLLCQFYDQLISCDVDIPNAQWKYSRPNMDNLPMSKRKCDLGPEWGIGVDGEIINLWEKDYIDLVMLLQYHNCRIGGCKKYFKNKLQECRFKMPKGFAEKTHIKYTRHKFKNGNYGLYEAEIIGKRVHNNRITNHNKPITKLWRANSDFSLVYNYRKVKQYVTKYTAKSEKKSNAFKAAFSEILINPDNRAMNASLLVKKILNKVLGLRDLSDHEALHMLNEQPLIETNIKVIKVNLESSVKVPKPKGRQAFVTSMVQNYANRLNLVDRNKMNIEALAKCNFIRFVVKFDDKLANGRLVLRSDPSHIALRFLQHFSSNNKGPQYWLHCKYSLLRYKPWLNFQDDALGRDENNNQICNNEQGWIKSWHLFLNTDNGKKNVPSHIKQIEDAQALLRQEIVDDDDLFMAIDEEDEEAQANIGVQAEWMGLQKHGPDVQHGPITIEEHNDIEYWATDRKRFSEVQLNEFKNWISLEKGKAGDDANILFNIRPVVLESSLNVEQLIGYRLLRNHLIDPNRKFNQFNLRTEGTAGNQFRKKIGKVERLKTLILF